MCCKIDFLRKGDACHFSMAHILSDTCWWNILYTLFHDSRAASSVLAAVKAQIAIESIASVARFNCVNEVWYDTRRSCLT